MRECAVVSSYFYMNYNVTYKCDFPARHIGRSGGAMQRPARYQICRPGFESQQGTSMWFPLVYCDVKYK